MELYSLVSKLNSETVKGVREKYGVKVFGSFEIKGYYVLMSFATDRKQVRKTFFKEEIEKGVNPITVIDSLVEAFNLK